MQEILMSCNANVTASDRINPRTACLDAAYNSPFSTPSHEAAIMHLTCIWVTDKMERHTHGADQDNSFEMARLSVGN